MGGIDLPDGAIDGNVSHRSFAWGKTGRERPTGPGACPGRCRTMVGLVYDRRVNQIL